MTVTISNGIVILLLLLQNTFAQHNVNNAQTKATCNTAGVNVNSVQPGQQINWQQPSNIQLAPVSQQPQNSPQPGMGSQVKQQSQICLSDVFSAIPGLRFSPQEPQGLNPSTSNYKQSFDQALTRLPNQPSPASNNAQNPQYANRVPESPKPTFTFQFVPVSSPNTVSPPENQAQNPVPIQFMTSGQSMTSQAGPSYYIQNQPTNGMASQQVPATQNFQTSSGPSQPFLFAVNSQQPTGQNQPVVYTLKSTQPTSSSGSQQKVSQYAQPNLAADNPMALLMSQLQSPSTDLDLAALLPMLMNSKQEKSGGMKTLLPLILNLLSDRGCGCPHCGCPCNNPEPTINGGYSNQINYSKQGLNDIARIPEPAEKSIEESNNVEFIRTPKKYKTNVISEISEEADEEDDDDEYEDDDD